MQEPHGKYIIDHVVDTERLQKLETHLRNTALYDDGCVEEFSYDLTKLKYVSMRHELSEVGIGTDDGEMTGCVAMHVIKLFADEHVVENFDCLCGDGLYLDPFEYGTIYAAALLGIPDKEFAKSLLDPPVPDDYANFRHRFESRDVADVLWRVQKGMHPAWAWDEAFHLARKRG